MNRFNKFFPRLCDLFFVQLFLGWITLETKYRFEGLIHVKKKIAFLEENISQFVWRQKVYSNQSVYGYARIKIVDIISGIARNVEALVGTILYIKNYYQVIMIVSGFSFLQ